MATTPSLSKMMLAKTLSQCGYSIDQKVISCLPDFFLTLKLLADGTVENAKQKGFYCFGEAIHTGSGKKEMMAGGDDFIESGKRIKKMMTAFKALGAGNDLRILRISGLSVEAIWKPHGTDSTKDVFIPYYSSVRAVTPLKSYEEPAFLSLLQPLARKKLVASASIAPL